jgi:hypothetical protein
MANLPLHYGNAPRWLFNRMKSLAREIVKIIIWDFGPQELLIRLADPFWFQSLALVLGFDWHSSGTTTTLGGALKAALKGEEDYLGFFVCGGKGKSARKTPEEIKAIGQRLQWPPEKIQRLVYFSKMVAKVDSVALQDGFSLYHHNFIFTQEGDWAVIQQGFNINLGLARRYHWLSHNLKDLVEEPHQGIVCPRSVPALNLTARQSKASRSLIVKIAQEEKIKNITKDLEKIRVLNLPLEHEIKPHHFNLKRLAQTMALIKEKTPQDFEEMLEIKGVGPKTVLALTLISEIIYGVPASWQDPVRYSFAHGGKDGSPFPVDRAEYDRSIAILRRAIEKARINRSQKINLLDRLNFSLPSYAV